MKNKILKNRREERQLTQVQIAQKVGITEACYQRYEAGKRIPRADIAILIATALHSSVEKLFGAATSNKSISPDSNPKENKKL